MISTLTLRFERLLNSLVRGVQLRVCAVGVELCVETCRGLEPGLIGSTAYSKIPTPPYNYMVICRTSNAPTPVGHATPRSCVVLRTPVHVTSPATLHGFNSRYATRIRWDGSNDTKISSAWSSTFRNVCIVRLRGRSGCVSCALEKD